MSMDPASAWLVKRLAGRSPSAMLALGLLVVGVIRLTVLVFSHWWLSWPLMLGLGCWWLVSRHGPATVAAGAIGVVLVLVAAVASWSWLGPVSFGRAVLRPWRSWRRGRHYRARWADAMDGAGLVRAGVEPTLMSCHGGETVDELLVHMAPGSLVNDWRDAARRLASALEVRSVRVRADGPRDVRLLVRHSAVGRHEWPADVDAEVAETTAQIVSEYESNGRLAERLVAAAPEPTEVELPRPTFPRRPR